MPASRSNRPEILVVCTSEVILYGVMGLLNGAGYLVHAVPDAWRARRLIGSRRVDLAIVGSTDTATEELLAQLDRCSPPIKALMLDGISRVRPVGQPSGASSAASMSLLAMVAELVGPPGPTSGSPGPTAA